jgi:hypothetical protein
LAGGESRRKERTPAAALRSTSSLVVTEGHERTLASCARDSSLPEVCRKREKKVQEMKEEVAAHREHLGIALPYIPTCCPSRKPLCDEVEEKGGERTAKKRR